jgi:hypothetical protein
MNAFKPVAVSDYPILKTFFSDHPYNLSIYSPSSIIAWSNDVFKAHYAIEEDTLFICSEVPGHAEDRHLIMPVSRDNSFSVEDLYGYAKKYDFEKYWYVPGDYLEKCDRSLIESYFEVQEQPEFNDYVYLTDDLINLRGNKYSNKRNLIHQFTRGYLRNGLVAVEKIHQKDVAECLQFLEIWCEQHACDIEQQTSLACEKKAVITTLENIEQLESWGLLIRIDGVVSAFGIGSRLNSTTAVLNFEKADGAVKGLYQYLDNQCAKNLFDGFRYINKESDMNLPNLAESKQSYHPVLRVKSYSMTLR